MERRSIARPYCPNTRPTLRQHLFDVVSDVRQTIRRRHRRRAYLASTQRLVHVRRGPSRRPAEVEPQQPASRGRHAIHPLPPRSLVGAISSLPIPGGPLAVVMPAISQARRSEPSPIRTSWSRHSCLIERMNRSANALLFSAATGNSTHRTPPRSRIARHWAVNFVSRFINRPHLCRRNPSTGSIRLRAICATNDSSGCDVLPRISTFQEFRRTRPPSGGAEPGARGHAVDALRRQARRLAASHAVMRYVG